MQLCNVHLVVCNLVSRYPLAFQTVGNQEYPICNAYTRWVLFHVKVRPHQELEAKLGDGWTFVGGPSFARLW